jgi:ABC-type antimicrobial peptide transport system permease subunit
MFGQMTFMLRHSSTTQQIAPAARRAVGAIDSRNPIAAMMPLDAQLGLQLRGMESYVGLLGAFASTALLLASVGVYGVMAYLVSQRTAEIGVRKALGAGRREVVSLIARPAVVVVGIGLTAGVAGSLLTARLIASQLWGVAPTDPATIGAMALLIAGVAALACGVPARRALAVDPTVALRSE